MTPPKRKPPPPPPLLEMHATRQRATRRARGAAMVRQDQECGATAAGAIPPPYNAESEALGPGRWPRTLMRRPSHGSRPRRAHALCLFDFTQRFQGGRGGTVPLWARRCRGGRQDDIRRAFFPLSEKGILGTLAPRSFCSPAGRLHDCSATRVRLLLREGRWC